MIIIVADASSLILLEKIGLLETLVKQNMTWVIPEEVQIEAIEKGKIKKYPDAFKLEEKVKKNQIRVKKVEEKIQVNTIMESFKIERGEAEAIILFQQEKADLLATDDRFAINTCNALNIPTSGSVAFVTQSFEKGLISKSKGVQMLETLANEGRYKSDIIFKAMHKIQGEQP
ncbi:MAG TPA: hypothetical protein VJH37_04165 [Candidatus Nanoarchaeia archaeon]|nr:hypothetical protein [Candidatus Nanoarchaeia archaeon]